MPRQHRRQLPLRIANGHPRRQRSSLYRLGTASREMPGRLHAVVFLIQHAVMMRQFSSGGGFTLALQVAGRGAEDMPLLTKVVMPQRIWPHIRTADTHQDIDAFTDRIGEAVRKRDMRHQQRVILNTSQDHRQRMQTAKGSGKIDAHPAARLGAFRLHRQFGLFQLGQHAGTGAIKLGAGVGQRQPPRGALEQLRL